MDESLRNIAVNQLVVDVSVDAIIMINSHGLVESFNPAAEKLFGYLATEIIGQNVSLLMPEPDSSQHDAYLQSYLKTRQPKIIDRGRPVKGQHRDGTVFDMFLSVSELEIESQIFFIGILRDISQEKTVVRELNISYSELEKKSRILELQKQEIQAKSDAILKASQYKSQFLSNMSHELRSPLNSMLILAKMLTENESGHLSDDEVESARIIYSSGQDLLKLINDILDLSKVEAGKLHLDKQVFPVKDLMANLAGRFQKIADNNAINLSVLIEADVPEKIYTDDHRLLQILRNLTDNAFKFTRQGTVIISVMMGNDTDLLFQVRDTGIGIPADKLDVIFSAFHQVDGSISRRYGGTGLGLSISNALAQLLGGKIEVASEMGQGSTFTLTLPADCLPPNEKKLSDEQIRIWHSQDVLTQSTEVTSEPIESDLNNHAELFAGRKILLVDDDLRNSFSLSRVLSRKGCQVSIADHGKFALDKMQSENFDLILMDMMMPVLDGYQTMQKIRQNPDWQELPIIALTSRAMPEDRHKCLAAGASDYLAKPIELTKLLEMMVQWLNT